MKRERIDKDQANQVPLYSTRIIKIYLEYLEVNYPQANVDSLLQKSGIEKHEIEDSAHWLSQEQVDRFHYAVAEETGNENQSRDAGRFAARSKKIGPLRQFALGFLSPTTIFLLMEKIYPMVSRGAVLKSNKIGANKVEITVTPTPEADEKIYQCENRIGFLEAIILLFTISNFRIKHDKCYHKGHPNCHYIIEWDFPLSYSWKWLLKLSLLIGLPALTVVFYILPYEQSSLIMLGILLIILFFSLKIAWLERKELIRIVKNQGNMAQDHLEEINRRYNDASLIQEIGYITTAIRDSDQLIEAVALLLEKHVDFDSGLIAVSDTEMHQLVIKAGFGANTKTANLTNKLVKIDFNLSDLSVIKAITSKKPVIATQSTLKKDQAWLDSIGFIHSGSNKSAIYIPIVYQENPIGILCFFSHLKNAPIIESDVNLLSGVASQLAIGITNARSYQYLRESEEKYRALIEATNTGFVIIDRSGRVQDANMEYVRLTGHQNLEDIRGKMVASWMAESDLSKFEDAMAAFKNENTISNFTINYEDSDGNLTPIEMNAAAVSIKNHFYVLSICRDMTEQKRTQEIMIQREKMSTVGALAAGMAHELNNPLAGILQTLQVLKSRLKGRSPGFNKAIKKYGLTVEGFYALHEKLGTIEKIDAIIETGMYAADIVKNMVNFSQKDHAEFTKHNIVTLLDKTIEIAKSDYSLKDDYDFKTIEIIREYGVGIPEVPCASAKIQQVFLTILKNGAQEMFQTKFGASKPRFILRISSKPGFVDIEIEDNGPGMSDAVLNRIFEPFYSTKQVGTGIGLGLSLAYFIIKDNHHGELSVHTVPGKGTRFIIKLPTE